MTTLVYLAGPISGLEYEGATGWRERFAGLVGLVGPDIQLLSPMRGKSYLKGTGPLKDVYQQSVSPLSTQKGIITRDAWDVGRCDVVVGNFLGAIKASLGTAWEYGRAYTLGKPIITVMDPEGNPHDHAFIRESSGFIVPTLEEAAEVLLALTETTKGTPPRGYPFTSPYWNPIYPSGLKPNTGTATPLPGFYQETTGG